MLIRLIYEDFVNKKVLQAKIVCHQANKLSFFVLRTMPKYRLWFKQILWRDYWILLRLKAWCSWFIVRSAKSLIWASFYNRACYIRRKFIEVILGFPATILITAFNRFQFVKNLVLVQIMLIPERHFSIVSNLYVRFSLYHVLASFISFW